MEIAGVGVRRPSSASESCRKGHEVEARRSDSSISTSFDEAAVEAGRVLPSKGARQRASEAGTRPSRGPKTPARGRVARKAFDQEPTGPSRAGPEGNQRTSRARPKLWVRRQASLHPRSRRSPTLRPGERLWKPPFSAKVREGVIRESSGSIRVLVSSRWLQKSERSIFPAMAKRAERCVEPRRGSLTRRLLLDEESRFVAGERVLGERTQANSERARTRFGCKAEDRTDGRRPGSRSPRP